MVPQEGTVESIASHAREIAFHNCHSKNVVSTFAPRFWLRKLGSMLSWKWESNEFVAV